MLSPEEFEKLNPEQRTKYLKEVVEGFETQFKARDSISAKELFNHPFATTFATIHMIRDVFQFIQPIAILYIAYAIYTANGVI